MPLFIFYWIVCLRFNFELCMKKMDKFAKLKWLPLFRPDFMPLGLDCKLMRLILSCLFIRKCFFIKSTTDFYFRMWMYFINFMPLYMYFLNKCILIYVKTLIINAIHEFYLFFFYIVSAYLIIFSNYTSTESTCYFFIE